MKAFGLSLLFSALMLCGFGAPAARTQSPAPQDVSAEDVKAYIQQSKNRGERWGLAEEKYVLDNFRRPELNKAIDNWQVRNQTKLSKDVRVMVTVDYLLTELNGMKVLPTVLDSIAKGEQTSVGKQVKTQVAGTVFREYQMARVRVDVNLESVDVIIDGKLYSQVGNKTMFVVTAGQSHSVVVSQGGFRDCTNNVTVEPGRVGVVACTLNSAR
jgi:hypothetical protein